MQSKDEGSSRARIVLIGEAYGHWESVYSRPFVGPSWTDKLKPWLADAGLSRDDLYITNAYDQGQPSNIHAIPETEMRASFERLHDRLAQLDGPDGGGPFVIVPVGNLALYALTGNGRVSFHSKDGRYERPGIKEWRGSILSYTDRKGRRIKVIGSVHPASTFYKDVSLEWVLRMDWQRIAADAQFRELRLPERTKLIAPSAAEAIEWIRWTRAEAAKRANGEIYTERLACSLDVETPYKVEYETRQQESKSSVPTAKCRYCTHTRRWHNTHAEDLSNGNQCLGLRGKGGCDCKGFGSVLGKPRRIKISEEAYLGCVGYSWDASLALCIPTTLEYWQDEIAWRRVKNEIAAFHADPNVDFGGQNFTFDAWWLAEENMPLHHLAWDLMKMHREQRPWSEWNDLAFQASLDTRQPFWKHEAKTPDELSRWSHNKEQLWAYNCLAADSQVLLSTFETKRLGDIKIGDKLLAPDENGGAQRHGEVSRRWRIATVTKKKISNQQCIRVRVESGRELVLTPDHPVLVDLGSGGKRWIKAEELELGSLLVAGLKPCNPISDERRGWLGGFFDGEGTVLGISMKPEQQGRSGLGALSYSQKIGSILAIADKIVDDLGFKTGKKNPIGKDGSAVQTYLLGGTQSSISLLAAVPSYRLRAAIVRLIERGDIHATALFLDPVVSIRKTGIYEVVDITTTTGTFIANGLVVHNCVDNVVQRELLDVRVAALKDCGRYEYYREIEAPIDTGLVELSRVGIRGDEQGRAEHFERVTAEAKEVSAALNAAAEMPIVGVSKKGEIIGKVPSPAKLKVFLYEKLRLPLQYRKNQKKQKVVSTDVVTIKRLMENFPGNEMLQTCGKLVLKHRRLNTEAQYVKAERLTNGRQYGFFKQETALGRLKSAKTPKGDGSNLQNVDRKLRRYYLPDTGDEA